MNGVSTRKVERLVTQLGLAGMSKSAVSRLCAGLDEQVRLFRERPLEGRYPYLWLDAKVEKVREPGGVRSKALVVAYGVHETGRREVIGIDVGEAETEAFWREFLRSLRARGLAGVQLCVSDAHEGLKSAIAQVLGCPWQRCTVHFLRDMLGHCGKASSRMVAAAIRQIFAAEDAAEARERLGERGRRPGAERRPRWRACSRPPRTTCSPSCASRAEHWSQAALDQPARARQPRDRPAHRRRRHLPQRRRPDPPRRERCSSSRTTSGWSARRYLSEESLQPVLARRRTPARSWR